MKSVMRHTFSQVPHVNIPRSSLNRSSGYKTTFDAGHLVPFFQDTVLPGDTFNLRTAGFARLATPIFPVMDNMFMDTFYFFVPNRLIWDNWEKMMGEQENPGDSTDYLIPIEEDPGPGGYPEGGFMDYLGVPTKVQNLNVSALYRRAYHMIWNEWFRDQNLQSSLPEYKDDGPDPYNAFTDGLLPRGKRHDYFTSCLPWPQKGPDVQLPLGSTAPVNPTNPGSSAPEFQPRVGGLTGKLGIDQSDTNVNFTGTLPGSQQDLIWTNPRLETDLSNASSATVNEWREAIVVQQFYEQQARGGTRYTEVVRSMFGVTSPDARLQRPEYLGGGSTPINVTPLSATADTLTDTSTGRELGSLSAVGTASFSGHGFTKSFTEHGILLGFVNVRADLTYQQGIDREFTKRDKFDLFWPVFNGLGEQAVLNKELYADGSANDDLVFGYQERFAEYRYKPSRVTARFRSNAAQTLDAWHLSQDFATLPTLSNDFIIDQPPIDRVIAVTDEPHFIADFYHKLICARPMPVYGVPGLNRF